MNSVEFNRLEGYMSRRGDKEIIASFDTRQNGVFQLAYVSGGHRELQNEPNLMVFTKAEQQYMKEVSALCWKIVFDSKKPDFDSIQ